MRVADSVQFQPAANNYGDLRTSTERRYATNRRLEPGSVTGSSDALYASGQPLGPVEGAQATTSMCIGPAGMNVVSDPTRIPSTRHSMRDVDHLIV